MMQKSKRMWRHTYHAYLHLRATGLLTNDVPEKAGEREAQQDYCVAQLYYNCICLTPVSTCRQPQDILLLVRTTYVLDTISLVSLYSLKFGLKLTASNVTQPAIIWGVVSNSLLLSTPAEAVEAIHGFMPPVVFQGFSWAFIDHVASWALCYTCFVPWRCPPQISAKYHAVFLYTSKIS